MPPAINIRADNPKLPRTKALFVIKFKVDLTNPLIPPISRSWLAPSN